MNEVPLYCVLPGARQHWINLLRRLPSCLLKCRVQHFNGLGGRNRAIYRRLLRAFWCEDRVLDGPASGEQGSKGRTRRASALGKTSLAPSQLPPEMQRTVHGLTCRIHFASRLPLGIFAAHRDKRREWGRLNPQVKPLLPYKVTVNSRCTFVGAEKTSRTLPTVAASVVAAERGVECAVPPIHKLTCRISRTNLSSCGRARLWEGFRERRRCSRDTHPGSHITECT